MKAQLTINELPRLKPGQRALIVTGDGLCTSVLLDGLTKNQVKRVALRCLKELEHGIRKKGI